MINVKPLNEARALIIGAGALAEEILNGLVSRGIGHVTIMSLSRPIGKCEWVEQDPEQYFNHHSQYFKSFDIVLSVDQPRSLEVGLSDLRWPVNGHDNDPDLPMIVMRSAENNNKFRCQYRELPISGGERATFVSLPMELLPWTPEKRDLVASTVTAKFSPTQDPNFEDYLAAAHAVVDYQQSMNKYPSLEDEQKVLERAKKNGKASNSKIETFIKLFCQKGLAAAPETTSLLAHLVITEIIKLLTGSGHPINNSNLDEIIRIVSSTLPHLPPQKEQTSIHMAVPHILDASNPCSPLSIPFSKTALLLLDFHKFIVSSQPDEGKSVLSTASSLRSWARNNNILIIHCLIDLAALTPPNRKMASRLNTIHTKMSTLPPEAKAEPACIAALADEYTFFRPPSHVSALGSYGLWEFLKGHEIESLVVAGFSTSGCVINSVKEAADKGFVVTVVKDACADKQVDVHEVVMGKLLVGQAHVVDFEGLSGAWRE